MNSMPTYEELGQARAGKGGQGVTDEHKYKVAAYTSKSD
jgi:hypothetical protein